ncbi:MAG: NAD(P)/FAD-dependent oxidoreductase [Rhodospirillales bacterium]|nr:NAD(P)/FAD-dependent oxidoreductase [Rhodospirillales bacterium]
MTGAYDVAIIGAGVVGCAIARAFSRYRLKVVVLEADTDIGNGASKGNSAVLSTASDTPSGTLEQQLVKRGHALYRAEAPSLGLPIENLGSLTIAWNETEAETVRAMQLAMIADGFHEAELVGPDAIYRRIPALAPGAVAAVWEAEEAIVDPFSTPLAYALDALANGVDIRCSTPVTGAHFEDRQWHLATPGGEFVASLAINCGGLYGDRVDALGGNHEIKIKPRRGEFIVFDKSARGLLDVILKPVANSLGRGILLTPTVFGNILVGPTAEQVDDPDDWRCTTEGLAALQAAAKRTLPGLLAHEITTTYCGLRPGSDRPEYRIVVRGDKRWITVAGIRSTGLSAALGIAEYIVAQAMDGLVRADQKAEIVSIRVPALWERGPRPARDPTCVGRDARYGEVICHCEQVSHGEIEDALASPLPPRSLKALKRRTRAMFGRCQGFFCGARVTAMLDRSLSPEPRHAAE